MRHARRLSLPLAAAAFVMMAGSSAALATIEASMCVIDGALVITTDGDPGHKVKIMKSGDTLTKDKFKGATKSLGFTGSSHTVDPWSASGPWKPGTYTFEGKDDDGVQMSTTATLDDCEPDEPEVEMVNGCAVEDLGVDDDGDCFLPDFLPWGSNNFEVEFTDVDGSPACANIDHYDFHLQCKDSVDAAVTTVDPADCADGTCTVFIHNGGENVSDDDEMCTITVTAVDDTCNVTTSTFTYMTDEDGSDVAP
jgi:hypothetical protein